MVTDMFTRSCYRYMLILKVKVGKPIKAIVKDIGVAREQEW